MNNRIRALPLREEHLSKARLNTLSGLRASKLPLTVWIVLVSTLLALVSNVTILGYGLTGWAWVIPLTSSLFIILKNPTKIRFPLLLWLPWMLVVASYWALSEYQSLQRSAQLLCPLIVGMAVSTYRLQPAQIEGLFSLLKYLGIGLFITVIFKGGIYVGWRLPEITGLAPEVMTGTLLSTFYATCYAFGNRKAVLWWLALFTIPVISLTRTAIVAAGVTLPLNFGPVRFVKRIVILVIISLIGLGLFYTPRVQSKMFFSGRGEMSDILSKDFKTTGRSHMWERFMDGVEDNPWFGHGVGAGEAFVRVITSGASGYPHNDWVLSLYDYGIVGTSLYGLTLLAASAHAFRRARKTSGQAQLLFFTGASSFVPFAMLMFTDNIMVYASFFGNLQFTFLGLAYGSARLASPLRRARRLRW